MRGTSTRHTTDHQLLFPAVISSVLYPLFPMGSFRNRMPSPPTSRPTQQRAPERGATSAPTSTREINGRVDQLVLVQSTLQNGATPTLVAGFAMIIAQIKLRQHIQMWSSRSPAASDCLSAPPASETAPGMDMI